jgi:Flp pilus assembly protein TadG
MTWLRRRAADDRGAVLVAGLLLVIALLLVIGLAVDIGRAFVERRALASIADDAALVGSQRIDVDALRAGRIALEPDQARAAADAVLASEHGVRGRTSADMERVTVVVRRRVGTILLGLADVDELTVTARATAAPHAP